MKTCVRTDLSIMLPSLGRGFGLQSSRARTIRLLAAVLVWSALITRVTTDTTRVGTLRNGITVRDLPIRFAGTSKFNNRPTELNSRTDSPPLSIRQLIWLTSPAGG